MSGVYSLSTTVEIIFILPKLYIKKSIKKLLNSMRKTEQRFITFFHISFPKVLYKSVLLSIIKVSYKSVVLSVITCRQLSLTYHTQKYFIKAFYYLAKTWLCANYLLSIITCRGISLIHHFQKRILSVFCYVKFPLNL